MRSTLVFWLQPVLARRISLFGLCVLAVIVLAALFGGLGL